MSNAFNPVLTVDDATKHIGTMKAAADADVERVLYGQGGPLRFPGWRWLILANGEVCLCTFPGDQLFEELSQKGTFNV